MRSLCLQGPALSDNGILALRGLRNLEALRLAGLKRDRVSMSALTALQNALPECDVAVVWQG